jgi:DNA polymerase-3 subunit epsilon
MRKAAIFHHPKFGDLPLYYGWKKVPDNFVTETVLKQRGKRRTLRQRPIAVVQIQRHRRYRHYLLYDVTEAIEKQSYTAKQKATLQRVKARVTCQRCGISFVKLSPEGNCLVCQKEVDRRREARIEAIQWARELVKQPFLILDTETTGLGPWDRIVEIAVIDETGDVLLNTLINPVMHIPAGVTTIHGITDEMVQDCPTFQDILPELETILADELVVIYNVAFDTRFLARGGLKVETYRFQCAMLMYAKFSGVWSEYYKNWRRQSLQKACDYCGIQRDTMHRAMFDCEATRQVINYMAQAIVKRGEKIRG